MTRFTRASGDGAENLRRADISAKVFSPENGVRITVGGTSFDGGVIKSIRLVKETENLPVKGIVRSRLYVTMKTDSVFSPNAEVTVKFGSMNFAPHYVSRISRRGDMLSIEAWDLMRRLDNSFDDSLYNEKDEPYNAGLLLSNLAHQCGFTDCENIPGSFLKFYYGDIHGKTCREILNLVSEYAVGTFTCTNGCKLRFDKFLSCTSSVGVNWSNSAKLYRHSEKGPFSAVYGESKAKGEVYKAGSGGSFKNVLRVSGRLLNGKRVGEIMSEVANRKFQPFYCSHMDIMGAPDGLTAFITESGDTLISVKTEIIFGGAGIYGRASSSDICEDESEYLDLKDYETRKKVEEYKEYGSVVMTGKGLGVVSENDTEDSRERQTYFFSKAAEGVSEFDGAILDKIMPDKIEKVSDTCRKITYGSNSFLLKFKKGGDGSKSDITFEREEKA